MSAPPRILTLGAALGAVQALRALRSVCAAIDAADRDYRANDHEYQAAMQCADEALRACPPPKEPAAS